MGDMQLDGRQRNRMSQGGMFCKRHRVPAEPDQVRPMAARVTSEYRQRR